MPISNYPNGFANGVTIRGMPVLNSYPGNIYWVDSVTGSNGNDGTFSRPFASINGAIVAVTAGKGDILMLKPGHVETVSSAAIVNLTKAGMAIVGMGNGSNRPTLTFTTATTANIPITAADVSMTNVLFRINYAAVASVFTATGTATPTDFCLDNCEFRDLSSVLNAVTIVTGNATANSMNGITLVNNKIGGFGTTAATTPVKLSSATDRVTINDNRIVLAILNNTSAVLAHAANVVTNLEMARNKVFRPSTDSATGAFLITTTSTTNTGMVADNYVNGADVAGALLVTAGSAYGMMNNLYDGDADASGFVLPPIGVN